MINHTSIIIVQIQCCLIFFYDTIILWCPAATAITHQITSEDGVTFTQYLELAHHQIPPEAQVVYLFLLNRMMCAVCGGCNPPASCWCTCAIHVECPCDYTCTHCRRHLLVVH